VGYVTAVADGGQGDRAAYGAIESAAHLAAMSGVAFSLLR
jgi:hypothetical protein